VARRSPHRAPERRLPPHIFVAPFLDRGHEARLDELIGLIGAGHVLFGSDWPHGEGRDTPRHFDEELAPVAPGDLERVLRTNAATLLRG
jgi:predicted TIM-barrel fold metal-dependent hydrolase